MKPNKLILDGVQARWASVPHPIPVQQANFEPLELEFSPEWKNLHLIVQFAHAGNVYNCPVADNKCHYPAELTIWPDCAAICVLGYPTGSEIAVRATVNRLSLPLVEGSFAGGQPPVPPTPDLYQQLVDEVTAKGKEYADAAAEQAEASKTSAQEAAASAESAGHSADDAAGHMAAAQAAQEAAQAAQDAAEGAASAASGSAASAAEAAQSAESSASAAARAAQESDTHASTAEGAAASAQQAQEGAQAAKNTAESAASAAADSASVAAASAGAAGQSADDAAGHKTAAQEAQEGAQAAKNAAESAASAAAGFAADSEAAAQEAARKAESIHALSASAEGLPYGAAPQAQYDAVENAIRFGIPAGAPGSVGPIGPQGPAGSDASVTEANIRNALGYTPADPADYRTAAAQDDIDNSLSQRIDKVEAAQRPDAVEIGTLNVNGGNVSGFTNADYMIFNFIVDLRNKPFVVECAFTTGSDVNAQQNILDSQFGLALAIRDGKGIMALSSNGTSWDIGLVTGTMQIMPNSHYYARIAWDGTSYTGSLSTDGQTYISDMHAASSLGPYPRTIYIGGAPDLFGAGSAHPFHGTIDFTDSRLYIEGQEYWHGMGEVGLASRANVSLSNLDALGLKKFDSKQDKIADLAVIREGAGLGRTAIQSADMTAENLTDTAFGVKQSVINALVYRPVKRYGIRIKQSEPNPSDRVEYLYDAVGMEPGYMDFANGQFRMGGWGDAWFVKDNFPCMVKFDGTVDYKLNPNDYTLKADGGASDFENVDYAGNAMSALPLIWVKKYTENGYKYKIFCNVKYDDSYVAYPYQRPNGTIADYLYYPMVKGYTDANGRLRSIGGVKPTSGMNATQEKAAAVACGSRWGLVTWQAWNLIMDLQELVTKSTNRQAKLGRGHDSGGSSADNFLVCGSLKDKGQCYGYNDGSHAVKFLHIENPYGERWERVEGMLFINGAWNVKDTPGEAGYNFTGTGFTALTDVGHPSGEGWVKEFTGNEHGDFPLLVGGSDATYECDYYYQNTGITSVPFVGAACHHGSRVGRSVIVRNTAGNVAWDLGASPFLQNPS